MAFNEPHYNTGNAYNPSTNDYTPYRAPVTADDVIVNSDSLEADQQIIDSLAGMGEHDNFNQANLSDVLSQLQNTIKNHLMEHYEKEFIGGTVDDRETKPLREVLDDAIHDCPTCQARRVPSRDIELREFAKTIAKGEFHDPDYHNDTLQEFCQCAEDMAKAVLDAVD